MAYSWNWSVDPLLVNVFINCQFSDGADFTQSLKSCVLSSPLYQAIFMLSTIVESVPRSTPISCTEPSADHLVFKSSSYILSATFGLCSPVAAAAWISSSTKVELNNSELNSNFVLSSIDSFSHPFIRTTPAIIPTIKINFLLSLMTLSMFNENIVFIIISFFWLSNLVYQFGLPKIQIYSTNATFHILVDETDSIAWFRSGYLNE